MRPIGTAASDEPGAHRAAALASAPPSTRVSSPVGVAAASLALAAFLLGLAAAAGAVPSVFHIGDGLAWRLRDQRITLGLSAVSALVGSLVLWILTLL